MFTIPKPHPDFKCFDPKVKNVDEMYTILGCALKRQGGDLLRRTTPWEMCQWNEDELQTFKIELEMIDRLYLVCMEDDINCTDYDMVARVQYKNEPLFVQLSAYSDCSSYEMCGSIYVSRDPNLFLNVIETPIRDKNLIYKSLVEDGFQVDDMTEMDPVERLWRKNAPMLTYICHQVIYENEKALRPQISQLPKILVDSVENFIKLKLARKAY